MLKLTRPKVASPSDLAAQVILAGVSAAALMFTANVITDPIWLQRAYGVAYVFLVLGIVGAIGSVAWTREQIAGLNWAIDYDATYDRLTEQNEKLTAKTEDLQEQVEALAHRNEMLLDDLDALIEADRKTEVA